MKDLICFSHLRWDFVFQRPQHLMSRFSREVRVFYIEEPVFSDAETDFWQTRTAANCEVQIMVPLLTHNQTEESVDQRLKSLMHQLILDYQLSNYLVWYYSPMMLEFSDALNPAAVVYDCMDELSAFKGAPPELIAAERRLLGMADIVFTGGYRLFEAKKSLHRNIFPFPSSIDKAVFAPARNQKEDPADQRPIGHPRLGFFGVIDERFDTVLVKELAESKPDWQLVLIGPVVKIDPADLPQLPNIHYLGIKDYKQLPGYIAGWDICFMPFAINASTEFISPTKTPEFLAAGKRVISTPIHDVVHPYGDKGLVGIGANAAAIQQIAEEYLQQTDHSEWLMAADSFLADMSWDKTFSEMLDRIETVLSAKSIVHQLNEVHHV